MRTRCCCLLAAKLVRALLRRSMITKHKVIARTEIWMGIRRKHTVTSSGSKVTAMRRFVFSLIWSLAGTSIAFLLIEFGYRAYLEIEKPATVLQPGGRALNPGGSGLHRGGVTSLDRHGFRNALEDSAFTRPRRFLIVGDSVAFGLGVDDDETVSHLLNEFLADKGIGIASIAYPGLDTADLRELFLHYADLYEPIDGVIWFYHVNDAKQSVRYRSPAKLFRIFHAHPQPLFGIENELWAYAKSPTLLKHLVIAAKRRLQNSPGSRWEDYYATLRMSYHPRANTRAVERIYLAEIAKWTRENGRSLLFVVTPVDSQLADGHTRPQEFVANTLEPLGVEIFDVLTAMKQSGVDGTTLFIPGDHAHWNAKGHEFVARHLTSIIQSAM